MEIPGKKSDKIIDFPGHDRFSYPENIVRVTAGHGGESLLIFGPERTALYDCGMAYCHEGLIGNIEKALAERGRDKVDYVLASHSHYDHIGALPYIIMRWPDVMVCGAAKAKSVFESEGAKKTMLRLGNAARDIFTPGSESVLVVPLRVDRVVCEGDKIALGGDVYFQVLETKGHTDCSMTYVLEPHGLMFASESTGVFINPDNMHTAILKSYQDTIEAAKKCAKYAPKQVISPHYGITPAFFAKDYFSMYIASAKGERDFILYWADQGFSEEQIMEKFDAQFWSEDRGKEQPKPAFYENAKYTIKHILTVFRGS